MWVMKSNGQPSCRTNVVGDRFALMALTNSCIHNLKYSLCFSCCGYVEQQAYEDEIFQLETS
jgi:hypothetical protein